MLTHHTITIDGTTAHYWQRNPNAKQTIIFVHGFKGNHKGLTDLSASFPDFRTILLDLPGYGQSDLFTTRHTIKNYAEFIHNFIRQLNINHFDLIGHSYGGSIAIVYAGLYSPTVSHLVLISPGIPFESPSNLLAKLQLKTSELLPKKLRKGWLTSPVIEVLSTQVLVKSVSRKRKLELLASGIKNAREQRPQVIIECLNSFLSTPFYKYARKIKTPTLILAGDNDFVAPLDTQVVLGQNIPLSKVELMPNIGHLSPLERPGTVGRMIVKFLKHDQTQPTHLHQISPTNFTVQPRQHKVITMPNN